MSAVIISGAGGGIGQSTALYFGENSDVSRLYLVGRNLSKLEKVAASIPNSKKVSVIAADISNREKCIPAIRDSLRDEKGLIGVVANAGVGGENHFEEKEGDRWNEIIDINLSGTYYFAHACAPALKRSSHKFRHMVIVSSILARIGVPGYSAYCASKAGLLGLTRSLASEWARDHILVNAIAPGWVDTAMAEQGLDQLSKKIGKPFDQVLAEQMSMVPLGKMSTPEEIAKLITFLVASGQISITGQTIDINNGAFMS